MFTRVIKITITNLLDYFCPINLIDVDFFKLSEVKCRLFLYFEKGTFTTKNIFLTHEPK